MYGIVCHINNSTCIIDCRQFVHQKSYLSISSLISLITIIVKKALRRVSSYSDYVSLNRGWANYSFIQHNPTLPITVQGQLGYSLPPTLTWNMLLYFKATDKVLLAINAIAPSFSTPPFGLAVFAESAKFIFPRFANSQLSFHAL